MSYYVRFISTSKVPNLSEWLENLVIAPGLTLTNIDQELEDFDIEESEGALSVVEINRPTSELFQEELEEFAEDLEDGIGDKAMVEKTLENAKAIVCFRVLFGDKGFEHSLDAIGPSLTWLSENFDGLIQADGEGFYKGKELIFQISEE